jgi:hypothetical protein
MGHIMTEFGSMRTPDQFLKDIEHLHEANFIRRTLRSVIQHLGDVGESLLGLPPEKIGRWQKNLIEIHDECRPYNRSRSPLGHSAPRPYLSSA